MANKERWATITPHAIGIHIEFPVYPHAEAVATARRNVTPIHGAILPDPEGQPEFIYARFQTPTFSSSTIKKLQSIREEDPDALPSVSHELSAFHEETACLTLPERVCIQRILGELNTLMVETVS